MLAPYDVEIMPSVFFEAQDKSLSAANLFRRRVNTTDRTAEDTLRDKFNMTTPTIDVSLPNVLQSHKPIKNRDKIDLENCLPQSVPQHKYDLVVCKHILTQSKTG